MKTEPKILHLLDYTLEEFAEFCKANDMPAFRARQVFEWIYAKGVTRFDEMTNLSKDLRAWLNECFVIESGHEVRQQQAGDGTVKLLLRWPDEATSECVMIADKDRRTACISSQIGCPVRCTFCASGQGGMQRQLSTGQIVEQVLHIRRLCAETGKTEREQTLNNLVFMGLGEPLANYKNVLKAVRIINADWGLNIGARKITISTVGLPSQIRKLADEDLQINLAISLHAPTDKLREELIPWARNTPIAEIVDAARYYYEKTKREVTLEYILLAGINDRQHHATKLVTLCRRMRCNVNLIRYNPVPGLPFERPTSSDAHYFAEILRGRGVNTHVRKSKGTDIDAACGQLRRSTMKSGS